MKKRIVCLMGVMTLAVCMLAAQGGQEKPKQQGSVEQPQGSGGNTTENGLGSFSLPISPKPVEFTIFLNFNNMPFNPEWPVWQEMAKRTNVRLKSVISQSNSNEKEAFNLMLSSGKLADVIGYVSGTDLEKLGRDGGLLPLNDLIRQYAPHIQY
jgi:putative aldouronate transport system substrate-binding protein